MCKLEILLKLSDEGRKWLVLLLPISFGAGWHLPQPFWMKWVWNRFFKKKDNFKEES